MSAEAIVATVAAVIALVALYFNWRMMRIAAETAKFAQQQINIARQVQIDSTQPYVWADIRPDEATGTLRDCDGTCCNQAPMRSLPARRADLGTRRSSRPTDQRQGIRRASRNTGHTSSSDEGQSHSRSLHTCSNMRRGERRRGEYRFRYCTVGSRRSRCTGTVRRWQALGNEVSAPGREFRMLRCISGRSSVLVEPNPSQVGPGHDCIGSRDVDPPPPVRYSAASEPGWYRRTAPLDRSVPCRLRRPCPSCIPGAAGRGSHVRQRGRVGYGALR